MNEFEHRMLILETITKKNEFEIGCTGWSCEIDALGWQLAGRISQHLTYIVYRANILK